MINTKNLDFHETFKPEKKYLSSLLTDLEQCSGHTMQEISQIAGIPTGKNSGKVVPTIYYLNYMGLINKSLSNKVFELTYTELGECVLNEEPGLIEPLTLLLLHCMLVRKNGGAPLWSYIVTTVIPRYHGKIDRGNLEKELELAFNKKVTLSPFIGTYSDLCSTLRLININDKELVMHPHLYNPEFIYLYGYILYEYWDEWYEEQIAANRGNVSKLEISADQLKETGFQNPFGWDEQGEYKVLEALHDKHIIELNRQMMPFTLRRLFTKGELIESLYSELC